MIDEIQLREHLIREQKKKEASEKALAKLHRSLEQQVEQRTHELKLVIETAYDAYISIDADNRVLNWNLAATAMFGWSRQQALGKPVSQLMFPDGMSREAEIVLVTYHARRRALDERLPDAMARAHRLQKPLAVLFMDLDGFKQVNDSHGHAIGDEFLREIAKRLISSARETDVVSRWAGDEYVLIREGVETESVKPLAQKLIGKIEQPLVIGEATLEVSTSVGVAMYMPGAPETVQELIKRADVAMYEAKRAGKAQVRIA